MLPRNVYVSSPPLHLCSDPYKLDKNHCIINISSIAGRIVFAGVSICCALKYKISGRELKEILEEIRKLRS
jgi:NADP-dependent 3-hydroxy acid dehydrogenase YdfG